jgi:tripartite-type tricarboxylate transporter receptor subunit TctC
MRSASVQRACRFLSLVLFAGFAATGFAQEYPSKLIRVVVPFAPGGSSEFYSRALAQHLRTAWGQPAVVENRPGATGIIGTDFVRRAAPDGYTLLWTSNTGQVLGPLLAEPRPFDPAADFTLVTKTVRFPLYLVIHPSVPARTLKEFIVFAKSRPGQLIYSSSGSGGTSHVATELFKDVAGIKALHVPYKGAGPSLQSTIAGETHFIFNNIGASQHLVQAGKLRGLAVTGDKRSPALPDVPTMEELGLRGLVEAHTWLGVLAPANLPQPIVNKLHAETLRFIRTPEIEKRMATEGSLAVGNTPAEFRGEIQSEITTWSRVIRQHGIKAE